MSSGRTRRDVGRRYNFLIDSLAHECFDSFTNKFDYSSVLIIVHCIVRFDLFYFYFHIFIYYLASIFPYRANQLFSEHSFFFYDYH